MTPLYQVDAFTAERFAGNPAAVCLLEGDAEDGWMQRVAAEMNLSETAFVRPAAEPGAYGLRWFTPAAEVALCGHATLATAHVLWTEERVPADRPLRFATLSGELVATRVGDAIRLDFPATPPAAAEPPAGLLEALGADGARWVGRSRFDYLVELASEEAVRRLRPDPARLRAVDTRGTTVTARASTPGFDFVSRFFAPAVGVDEDPVTGSAHCTLAPFWAGRLGRDELVGLQASARGGVVGVRLAGDRVQLTGQAVTVLRGELC
ncbi:MAG TPA: PhzF family phenazine biosynthesis protein [Actinomycetes bacterium]|nr:PhzF family phenazine biosynthesis protein [Actinomycetes bacterium]